MFILEQLDHVALTVRDIARSRQWYMETLGMEHRFPGAWEGVPTMLGLGSTLVALFPADDVDSKTSSPENIRIEHFAFRADRQNFAVAHRELVAKGLDVTFKDHTLCHSIYFLDPDGHQLEITTYEVP